VTKRKKRKPMKIVGLSRQEEEKTKKNDMEEDIKENKSKDNSKLLAPYDLKIPLL
jgi:hypothetical protein